MFTQSKYPCKGGMEHVTRSKQKLPNNIYNKVFIYFFEKTEVFNFTNIEPYPVKYFIVPGLIFQPKK